LRKLLLVFVVVLSLSFPMICAVSVEDSRSSLAGAFKALSRAESAGGDVRDEIRILNNAATLIDKGGAANLAAADQMIEGVVGQASTIEVAGSQRITNRYIVVGITLVVLVGAAVTVWFWGSRIFWVAWLRVKKGWRVERV
jgi:hypothetical protein